MNNIKKFEVGATYFARSTGDYDCIYKYRVVKRTEKTITLDGDGWEKPQRKKVYDYNEIEHCRPEGSYSMAPIIGADKFVLADGTLVSERAAQTQYNAFEKQTGLDLPDYAAQLKSELHQKQYQLEDFYRSDSQKNAQLRKDNRKLALDRCRRYREHINEQACWIMKYTGTDYVPLNEMVSIKDIELALCKIRKYMTVMTEEHGVLKMIEEIEFDNEVESASLMKEVGE